jgi:hypothetical protein
LPGSILSGPAALRKYDAVTIRRASKLSGRFQRFNAFGPGRHVTRGCERFFSAGFEIVGTLTLFGDVHDSSCTYVGPWRSPESHPLVSEFIGSA